MKANGGSNPAKKFYFLDYFYIVLNAISEQREDNSIETVRQRFILLKDRKNLGESKYKKLTCDENDTGALTKTQLIRITYTFKQVLGEAMEYGLIRNDNDCLELTCEGEFC